MSAQPPQAKPALQSILVDIERVTLGAAVSNPLIRDGVAKSLPTSLFTIADHRLIHGALLELQAAGKPVDEVMIATHLNAAGKLEDVTGGMAGVVDIARAGDHAGVATVEYNIGLLRDAAGKRKAIAGLGGLREEALSGTSAEDLAEKIADLADETRRLAIDQSRAPLVAALAARRFNASSPPPVADPVFLLNGAAIATPGNLVAIQAQIKSGKSAAVGAMHAAAMKPTGDCLGFTSPNPYGAPIVHFDTEQSPHDHYTCGMTALRRAGLTEAPPWFYSFHIAELSMEVRRKAIAHQMAAVWDAYGFIHSVFLDGVADFIVDPNDPAEAFSLVAELHQLAIKYETVIVCVIHENPGNQNEGKTRGHLGSQLERKAESNIRLAKESDVVTIFTDRSRHASVPRDRGPRFQWSDEAKMHVSVESARAEKTSKRMEKVDTVAKEVFKGVPAGMGLSWGEIMDAIVAAVGLKNRNGGRRIFDEMRDVGLIYEKAERWHKR